MSLTASEQLAEPIVKEVLQVRCTYLCSSAPHLFCSSLLHHSTLSSGYIFSGVIFSSPTEEEENSLIPPPPSPSPPPPSLTISPQVEPDKAKIGKAFKKEAKQVFEHLASLDEPAALALKAALEAGWYS